MLTVGDLIAHLKHEQQKGLTHVSLGTEAREAVRTAVKAQSAKKAASQPAAASTSAPAHSPSSQSRRPTRQTREITPTPSAPANPSSTSRPVVAPEQVKITLPSGSKAEQLAALHLQAQQWLPAQSLGTLRNRLVFSTGSPESSVVLVGEAPGYEEELKNEPFVGKSGQKLNQILKAMGLSREEVYLTNVCKFRPALPGQTTNNRKPSASEIAACLPLLQHELAVLAPRCIVALGATAAEALLGETAPLSQHRGQWLSYQGNIPLRVTYHPSYLLRHEDRPGEKRKVWEDMLAVMEHLQLPISEKQRGYFTS